MGFMFSDILSPDENTVKIGRETLLRVLFLYKLERVDDDKTVPKTGVNLLLCQSSLQLRQHLSRIDDVHFDQILFDTIALTASLQLVGLDFERCAVFCDSADSTAGLIDGERNDTLNNSLHEDIRIVLVGKIYPTPRVLYDPANIEQVLIGLRLEIAHSNI